MAPDATAELPILAPTNLSRHTKVAQIDGLQILRAVAVFLVAWLHAGLYLGDWRLVELPDFGPFGIDIFFVISGFIMSAVVSRTQQEPGAKASWAFLKRRLIRIFPIYWLFALLASERLLHAYGFFSRKYFPSFLLLPGLYPRFPLVIGFSWTMTFEMLFYYVLAAILLVTVKRAVPVSIAAFGLAALVGRLIDVQNPTWIPFSSPILLEFIFGATIAVVFSRLGRQRGLGIVMLVLGTSLALYLRAHPEQGGVDGLPLVFSSFGVLKSVFTWGIAATLIVSGMVFWSPRIQNLPGRIAVALGNASYSAYLASPLVIEYTMRPLLKLGRASVVKEVLFQGGIVVAVLGVGWVSYCFVERPMIRWLQDKF